jgi:hypothetical protein
VTPKDTVATLLEMLKKHLDAGVTYTVAYQPEPGAELYDNQILYEVLAPNDIGEYELWLIPV